MRARGLLHVAALVTILATGDLCLGQVATALSPPRTAVILVVYGAADLTLVREIRAVNLGTAPVSVCMEWPGVAVDRSSIMLRAPDDVTVGAPVIPPGRQDTVCWTLHAPNPGSRELQLTYLISGIDWRPFYRLVLDEAGGSVELEGLVTLRNRSGQRFEAPQIRLVVGELRLIENLAEAVWKTLPQYREQTRQAPPAAGAGLSERYVYDVGTIPSLELDDTYTLPFLPKARVTEAKTVYRLHHTKYGQGVHQVLVFDNTANCGLGSIPLAAADAQVTTVARGNVVPRSSARVPYTPIGEECEIDLGVTTEVVAERRVVRQQRTNFEFDRFGQVEGYDEREWVEVQIRNLTDLTISFEYTDTVPGVWEVAAEVPYVEEGMNEVTFRIEVAPQSEEQLSYRLLKRQGRRVRLGPVRPK